MPDIAQKRRVLELLRVAMCVCECGTDALLVIACVD